MTVLGFSPLRYMLVCETAHKPAAYARYLCWVQGESLLLCHLHRDGSKICEVRRAAQLPPAGANPTHLLCRIPHTNLLHLYPYMKLMGKVPDQLPEVYPAVGSKKEYGLILIKGILHSDQLHWKPSLLYLLQTNRQSLSLFLPVLLFPFNIFRGRNPHYPLKLLGYSLFCHLSYLSRRGSKAHTHFGIHHHLLSPSDIKISGIKIIYLACVLKFNA